MRSRAPSTQCLSFVEVEGTLYCIHRYFFSRDPEYFSCSVDIPDHEAWHSIISLDDTERRDYDAFLSILYPEYGWWSIAHRLTYQDVFTYGHFREVNLPYEEWRSVLHLSTRWGFALIRTTTKPPTPHDRLLLARTYLVDDWVAPALSALCDRTAPLTLSRLPRWISTTSYLWSPCGRLSAVARFK
jgi:hypothetical protein